MVYFIQSGDAVKIGYTSFDDVKERMSHLQTGNPGELKTLLFMDGSRKDEANFHEMFSIYRIRGEWFHLVSFYHLMIKGLFEKKLGRFIPSKQVAFDVIR